MNTVYIYCGLPGSGKTTTARIQHSLVGGVFLDDRFDKQALLEALETSEDVFITDPYCCFEQDRAKLVELIGGFDNKTIKFMFFENDCQAAIDNIHHRNDGRLVTDTSMRNFWSKGYKIPEGVEVVKVWRSHDK